MPCLHHNSFFSIIIIADNSDLPDNIVKAIVFDGRDGKRIWTADLKKGIPCAIDAKDIDDDGDMEVAVANIDKDEKDEILVAMHNALIALKVLPTRVESKNEPQDTGYELLLFGFIRGFGRFLYIAIMGCGTGKTLFVQ